MLDIQLIVAMLLEAYQMGYEDGQVEPLENELNTVYYFEDEDEE